MLGSACRGRRPRQPCRARRRSAPPLSSLAAAVRVPHTVDRTALPFVVVYFHASIYHSYYNQYKQADTFREVVEPLFVQHAVDLVLAGHVHRWASGTVSGCGMRS